MDKLSSIFRSLSKSTVHVVLIILVGLLCYSNTLKAPFQWDELAFIEDYPLVKDISYFLEPSKAEGHGYYHVLLNRYIGFLTFALNYKIHGLDVTGYHIVNISIHLLNSLLVYFLVVLTFKTPFFVRRPVPDQPLHASMVSFLSALLFVSHPVQTEAVTYIFQRHASLVTTFYLLSMLCYIKYGLRQSADGKVDVLSAFYYPASLISCILAMKTKENAFTLPIMITMYEFFFFDGRTMKRLLRLIPILLTLLIIPLTLTGIDRPAREIIGSMADAARGDSNTSRPDYLFTQIRVVVTYIRLLFFPADQNIDYDYPVFHSFFDQQVLLSFMFHLSIFCFSVYLFYRSRIIHPAFRLTAFGITWFYITLSVESSVIPIPMIINEYRIYLPSVGFFAGASSCLFLLISAFKSKAVRNVAIAFLALIPITLSYAAHERNGIWKNEISLWEDVVRKSPGKARGYNNLGFFHSNQGNIDKAIEYYHIALKLDPYEAKTYNNLGTIYGNKGMDDKALEYFRISVNLRPDFAEAHFNLGLAFFYKGLMPEAAREFETALQINPAYEEARRRLSAIAAKNASRPR
ncbi:MAG: tetratricopeptide repeat protein [Deltaproteobacteria bacterium]|nr:tetratricopeptide repeat protein [Deltaproteobacteria bacterium]